MVRAAPCSPCSPFAPADFTCCPLTLQTYGSKNLLRVGVILQRATIIILLCCFPCCGLLINVEQLMLLMHQDPDVSRLGGPLIPPQCGGAERRVAMARPLPDPLCVSPG